MTLNPASHRRFRWFPSGLIGGGGRGGPGRLIGIVSVIALAVGVVIFVSIHSDRFRAAVSGRQNEARQPVAGRAEGTPAQDALLKTDSQEKANEAEEKHRSYTPPMPSSNPFNGRMPAEAGLGGVSRSSSRRPQRRYAFRAGDRSGTAAGLYAAGAPGSRTRLNGARVERVAADDGLAQGRRRGARGISNARRHRRLAERWNSRPPETTVVLEPAAVKEGSGDPPALGKVVEAGRRRRRC